MDSFNLLGYKIPSGIIRLILKTLLTSFSTIITLDIKYKQSATVTEAVMIDDPAGTVLPISSAALKLQ